MAHELDQAADGSAAMFSTRETPWHGLGKVLREAPSLAEGMVLGGLNFEVELRDLTVRAEFEGEAEISVPDHKAVVRTDRNKVLGVVGSRYQPLQNYDAFRVLEPLLDRGVAKLETGGTLREGRDTWMMVRFDIDQPQVREVFASEVVPFGLISNNHSGNRQVVLQETPIRVVCANTLGMALRQGAKSGRAIGVRHTASVEAKVIEAAEELWKSLIERYTLIAGQYAALKKHYLEVAQFRALVLDVISPIPVLEPGQEKPKNFERSVAKAEERRANVSSLWWNGKGHKGDGSAWEAYNATVESIDHDVDEIWSTRGDRLASLMDGRLGQMKQDVLDGLVAAATREAA